MAASLLGFATACDTEKEIPVEYGTPNNNFKVQGKVTDKSGRPIPGIEVRNRFSHKKTTTDAKGSYTLEGKGFAHSADLRFVDIDGPANGGEFAEKQVVIDFTEDDRTAPGDKKWYSGAYARKDVDAQLEEKE